MARPVVEVDGLRQLRRELRQAGDDMADLKEANAKAASLVATSANPPYRDGHLDDTVRSSGTKTAGVVRAGRKSVPYAGPIHYGWPARNITAQPFLTETARATEPQWVPIYLDQINEILAQVKGAP